MLVGLDTVLQEARREGYAVGSFNVNNLETTLGVLEAAVERRSPVIISFGEAEMYKLVPMESMVAMMRELAIKLPIPVVVLLDHGRTFEGIVRAIRSGATSVMFDGSLLPFEENVARTQEVVRIARAAGVAVEAEVGHVGQAAEYSKLIAAKDQLFTKPSVAVEFVKRTGVDALAVSVGTAHGQYIDATPELDFDLICKIRDALDVPLVLHGGSGTGDENLRRAVACGIAKVNIYTDMALAAKARIQQILAAEADKIRFAELLFEAKAAFKEMAGHYMDVFGSTGKAKC